MKRFHSMPWQRALQMPLTIPLALLMVISLTAAVAIPIDYRTNYKEVVLRAEGPADGPIDMTVTMSDGSRQTFRLQDGETRTVLVREGDYQVTARQGRAVSKVIASTENAVDNGSSTTVQLKPVKTPKLAASKSQGCGFFRSGAYFSYDCFGESIARRHDIVALTAPGSALPVSGLKLSAQTVELDGKVLTMINEGNSAVLRHYDLAGNTTSTTPMPFREAGRLDHDFALLMNEQSGSAYQFAVIDLKRDAWYLYRNLEDTSPQKVDFSVITKPLDNELGRFSMQLIGDRLVGFYAPDLLAHDEGSDEAGHAAVIEEAEAREKARIPGRLIEYSTRDMKVLQPTEVSPSLRANDVRWLASDHYLLTDDKGFTSLARSADGQLEVIAPLVANNTVAIQDGRVLLWEDGVVYEFDAATGTSTKLFSSDKLRISRAFYDGNSIGFTAFPLVENGTTPADPQAYLIER